MPDSNTTAPRAGQVLPGRSAIVDRAGDGVATCHSVSRKLLPCDSRVEVFAGALQLMPTSA
jgi:hypothetical protein